MSDRDVGGVESPNATRFRNNPQLGTPVYEYKKVRVQDDVAVEAQNYANLGWRTVSVFREKPVILGHVAKFEVLHLLIERVKPQPPSGT